MSCAALLPAAVLAGWAPAPAEAPARCVAGEVEVAGRLQWVDPDPGLATAFELPRARLSLGAWHRWVSANLRLGVVRSAGEGGYVGVEGEAFVPTLEAAEAAITWAPAGLRLALGAVPDVWVHSGDRAWGQSALWGELGDSLGWMDRSDLGLRVDWTGLGGRLAATGSFTTGEGTNFRERNEGKDLAGLVAFAPFAASATPRALVVELYGRDGSRGLGYAPDSRVGARVAGELPRFGYGAEVLAAWGVAGDGSREPVGASAWVRGRPLGPLVATARVDGWSEDLDHDAAASVSALAAAGVQLPFAADADRGAQATLLAGARHTEVGRAVTVVPGADTLESGTTLFLQLDVTLQTDWGSP